MVVAGRRLRLRIVLTLRGYLRRPLPAGGSAFEESSRYEGRKLGSIVRKIGLAKASWNPKKWMLPSSIREKVVEKRGLEKWLISLLLVNLDLLNHVLEG